jgi:hypothetical protein
VSIPLLGADPGFAAPPQRFIAQRAQQRLGDGEGAIPQLTHRIPILLDPDEAHGLSARADLNEIAKLKFRTGFKAGEERSQPGVA